MHRAGVFDLGGQRSVAVVTRRRTGAVGYRSLLFGRAIYSDFSRAEVLGELRRIFLESLKTAAGTEEVGSSLLCERTGGLLRIDTHPAQWILCQLFVLVVTHF